MATTRLITWNLNGRVAAASEQVAALAQHKPDLVACQEVRRSALDALKQGFKGIKLDAVVHTVPPGPPTGPRALGLLVAGRYPLERFEISEDVAWPERLLGVESMTPSGRFRLLDVGVPPGVTNGWKKIDTIEACLHCMATPHARPLVVVGDFNTPREERSDPRSIVTWGQRVRRDGTVRLRRGMERWDRVERALFDGRGHGLRDAYRSFRGMGSRDFSWYGRSSRGPIGRRYDHCFVSAEIDVERCEYLHSYRETGLSDHSPLEIEIVVGGAR